MTHHPMQAHPRELYHRSKKVTALCDCLWRRLSDAERRDPELGDRLRRSGQAWRDALAHKAGIRTPSFKTWASFCSRVEELVAAERKHAELMKVVGPGRVTFRSIDRPEVGFLGPDDVFLCDECGTMTGAEYERDLARFGHQCLTCRGYRIVHGYSYSGCGYPVVLVEGHRGGGAASAPSGKTDSSANNRRGSPPSLPPAA